MPRNVIFWREIPSTCLRSRADEVAAHKEKVAAPSTIARMLWPEVKVHIQTAVPPSMSTSASTIQIHLLTGTVTGAVCGVVEAAPVGNQCRMRYDCHIKAPAMTTTTARKNRPIATTHSLAAAATNAAIIAIDPAS